MICKQCKKRKIKEMIKESEIALNRFYKKYRSKKK
tara:strand:+ start:1055 stop:1159 length:105 start_codon:yes stop_codon:yes gene_type:complete